MDMVVTQDKNEKKRLWYLIQQQTMIRISGQLVGVPFIYWHTNYVGIFLWYFGEYYHP